MKIIQTGNAPQAVGPYSQATVFGELTFCSGQLGLDPATMKLVSDDIRDQARQALSNMTAVLDAAGMKLTNIVKTTVFITDMSSFPEVNKIYAEVFGDHAPARSTVEVAALPLGGKFEIECIAAK